eukprot:6196352-Pleurochrysis_carterae.AAC.3
MAVCSSVGSLLVVYSRACECARADIHTSVLVSVEDSVCTICAWAVSASVCALARCSWLLEG